MKIVITIKIVITMVIISIIKYGFSIVLRLLQLIGGYIFL